MTSIPDKNFDEQLSLHLRHFQDGFRTLSGAASRSALAEAFAHMLRSAFSTPEVLVAQRRGDELPTLLYPAGKTYEETSFGALVEGTTISDDRCFILGTFEAAGSQLFQVRIGPRDNSVQYSEFDALLLTLFLQLLGSTWQYYDATERDRGHLFDLNSRVLQLHDLVDAGVEMLRLEDERELLQFALQRCVALTDSTRGTMDVSRLDGEGFLINFPHAGEDLEPRMEKTLEIDAATLRLTLSGKESRSGDAAYTDTDSLLVDGLTRQLKVTLENRELQKQALEKQRYENELVVAAEIQQRLLPEILPKLDGYEIAGISIPTYDVGGDFYDCLNLPDGRIALVMADVAGKGIPAALLVNSLHAALHSGLRDPGMLTDLMAHLNRFIYAVSTSDKFITCFLCILDPSTGSVDMVNAGHDPGLIVSSDGSLRHLEAGGVSLGMVDMNLPYSGQQLTLEKGEGLLLFTDGLPEAMNAKEEPYGDDTFEGFLVCNRELAAEHFLASLVSDVLAHTGDAPRSDDITALYVRRM